MSDNGKNQKKKKPLRLPMIVKITLLFVTAALLGSLLVFSISRNIRMKRAIQQGGESALNGCYIAKMLLEMYDPSLELLCDTGKLFNSYKEFSNYDEFENIITNIREELRNKYFVPLCSTLEL